jgi:TRAP transporter TAXI family solute receptor
MTNKILIAAAAGALALGASAANAQEAIRIGTSSVGSVFYTIAIGASEIITKHAKLNTTVEPVGGSTASVNSLGAKKIEFAMANSFATYSAFNGKYRFKEKVALRLVVNGQPNFRSMVVRKAANIKSAQDLVGKIIVGKRRALPENELVMNAMMKVLGLAPDSLRVVGTTNSPQVYKALRAGSVDGAIIPYSARSPAVEKPMQDDVIDFFEFSKEKRDEAMQHLPQVFYPFTFKAGTFAKQTKPVHVFGLSTYFITRPDVSDELVYRVAKAILENNKEFVTYHRATRLWNLERTASDPKLPYHPGVIKYLKEKGVWTAALEAQHKALLQ